MIKEYLTSNIQDDEKHKTETSQYDMIKYVLPNKIQYVINYSNLDLKNVDNDDLGLFFAVLVVSFKYISKHESIVRNIVCIHIFGSIF